MYCVWCTYKALYPRKASENNDRWGNNLSEWLSLKQVMHNYFQLNNMDFCSRYTSFFIGIKIIVLLRLYKIRLD